MLGGGGGDWCQEKRRRDDSGTCLDIQRMEGPPPLLWDFRRVTANPQPHICNPRQGSNFQVNSNNERKISLVRVLEWSAHFKKKKKYCTHIRKL